MKVTLGVSKRHVHLTEETYKILFGEEPLVKRNDLGQPLQFASTSTVDLVYNNHTLEHVRVIGPLRKYNQIELSESDAKILEINPPRRQSGDLDGSLPITLVGPLGNVDLASGAILAERHIHMEPKMAKVMGVKDKDLMHVYKNNKYLFDSSIKISDPGALEIHIDTDEAIEYNLETGDELDFRVCGK